MKVNSKVYKGIEYIQLTDLPKEQQDLIVQYRSEDFFIKILVENNVVNNCIQYRDYDAWFETVYRKATVSKKPAPVNTPVLKIVFGKA